MALPLAEDEGKPTRYRARGAKRPRQITQVIVAEVISDIASKRLKLGEQLPSQQELAAQFGVSQPTIREAISALAAMGLVEVRHGSGAFVTRNVYDFVTSMLTTLVQVEDVGVLDVLGIRGVLASYSVERAALNATEEEIETIRRYMRACDEAREIQDMARAIVSFQLACSRAAHNPLLYALESFVIKAAMHLQLTVEGPRGTEFWLDQTSRFSVHRQQLVECIAARDAKGAVDVMKAYLAHQQEWFGNDDEMSHSTMHSGPWFTFNDDLGLDEDVR